MKQGKKSFHPITNSFDGDLALFNDHSDENMIIFESELNKKGKIHKAMQKRHCVAYTDRKFAYFRHPKDASPAGYILLPTVSTINIYLPKNNNKKNKKHSQSVGHSTDYDEKSFDVLCETNYSKTKKQRSWSLALKDISLKGDDNLYGFELVTPKRKWTFGCSDYQIFEKWIKVLRELCFGRLLHRGYLRKLGEKYKTWRRRFFVIYDLNEIRYFEDKTLINEKGKIELNKVSKIRETDSNEYHYQNCIELHTNKRIWVLATNTKEERDIWLNGIRSIMKQHSKTFISEYSGHLSVYNDSTGRFQKCYFALESNNKENRLCCFESQIAFKQLQSVTCYGDNDYNLICKTKIKHIINLNTLIDILIIPLYEFTTVNVNCKDDMNEYKYIFHIKLINNKNIYLCPHPNTYRMAQKWVNVIKNLKCSQRQNMYDKLAKAGYKPTYIEATLVQYENLYNNNSTKDNEQNGYNYNEVKGMIDRMAKPNTGTHDNSFFDSKSNSNSNTNSKSPTTPISNNNRNIMLKPLNECVDNIDASYSKILNDKRDACSWTNNDVLLWIKSFDNGLIINRYPNIINEIRKLKINGQQLKQLNAINFQQFGVSDEVHIALLLEAVSELQ